MNAQSLPRIRVVVLTFDGGDMTMECLRSLHALDWPSDRLEIVLVDNGSLDDVAERTRREFPAVVVLEPLRNLGFAGGCNLGVRHGVDGPLAAAVDYIALLNNDATVEPSWLRELVATMATSPDIGGVASKMLFADRFAPVTIEVLDPLDGGRRDELGVCVTALRLDGARADQFCQFDEGFHGAVDPDRARDEEFARWTRRLATLRVPDLPSGRHDMQLRLNSKRVLRVRVRTDVEVLELVVGEGGETVYSTATIALGDHREDVVNNVGSELYQFGFAGDRGFMETDERQFETPEEVFAWCGGAALLRAAHLDAIGLFDERLFLYYEDTDLAWRGRLAGWRHLYSPRAVVRHRHAQSSGVGSDVFRFHTERNRILVAARNAPLRVAAVALAAEMRHCARVNLALLIKRPLTLKMPSLTEPRHRRRVLAAILAGLPGALRSRRTDRPSIRRSDVVAKWERSKW